MEPFAEAIRHRGLEEHVSVLPVSSGYPSPKYVNLVLRRLLRTTFLFESAPQRADIVAETHQALDQLGVGRLDALLVTHCHGDHAGGSGLIAGRGRPDGERAPIYLHSAGHRALTQPESTFLQETYEISLARSQWGLREYNTLTDAETIDNALRKRFSGYVARVPKHALRFVDRGQIPDGIVAIPTPGHSLDCVLYYDPALGVAVPGDTIITTGKPEDESTWGYVIPIFTVLGQAYSEPYERFLRTLQRLRRFFETHHVSMVLPPHGRFAVTEPLEWLAFAEAYFKGIFRAFLEDFLGDTSRSSREAPFLACDLNAYIPSAGSHPISTPSHTFAMLCMLADEGYLSMAEDPHSRQIRFQVNDLPPSDYVSQLLAQEPGPMWTYGAGN